MLDTIKNKLFPPAAPPEEPAAPVDEVDAAPPEEPAAPVDEVDALKRQLFSALVAADGRLAAPEDIPYSPELLEGEALAAAIGKRLADNPRLGKNFAAGDVGAGNRGTPPRNTPDLMDMLKAAHSL